MTDSSDSSQKTPPSTPPERDGQRLCLLVEDDSGIAGELSARFSRYGDVLRMETCSDAGEALKALRRTPRPDALVLDIMMPYGSAFEELHGGEDPNEMLTGLRLLDVLRREDSPLPPVWVAVATARSPFAVGVPAKALLAGHGMIFYKPYNPHQLEDSLVKAIGIPSKVRPMFLLAQGEGER